MHIRTLVQSTPILLISSWNAAGRALHLQVILNRCSTKTAAIQLMIRTDFSFRISFCFPFLLAAALVSAPLAAQQGPAFLKQTNTRWADSVFKTMTPDERIGQLFMVAAYSNKDAKHVKTISDLVKNNKIGGLIFFQGGPVRQANLTNKYQKLSKVPLLISIDGEWGLAMRLDSTIKYPKQMTLGAIENDSLIYAMGRDVAMQCKRMGIHINLAPVADVNNNPKNPVIGVRSFGESKEAVARKAAMYMKGMQDAGIMTSAKHFPGHGDTESDSHKTLPEILHPREHIDSLELYPFKQLINEGLSGMMVAHLYVPAFDTTRNTATTLSRNVVTGLLKDSLHFNGLVFTDALDMKGVSKFYGPGEVNLKALLAGNDVLLFAEDVPVAIALIKKAIAEGKITQDEIDQHCKKILYAKQWAGLNHYKPIKTKNLVEDLNNPKYDWLLRRLADASVTVLQNRNNVLPLMRLDTVKGAVLCIGNKNEVEFQRTAALYTGLTAFNIDRDAKNATRDTLISKLEKFNTILVSINNTNVKLTDNFGITPLAEFLLDTLTKKNKRIVVSVFASPYALQFIPSALKADAVVMGYEELPVVQQVAAQVIFGGQTARGKFPVTYAGFAAGTGVNTGAPVRLSYTLPEAVNASREKLARIDSLALEGIRKKAYPGCQVIAVKDGQVFYMKSFGSFTYDGQRKVKNSDIYDLASITKIAATTAAVMKFTELNYMHLDSNLSDYLPGLVGTNKADIVLRHMLTHQAGLEAWIPFWKRTVNDSGALKTSIYRKTWSDSFPIRVATGVYIQRSYKDSIYKQLVSSSVSAEKKYKYSDLGYYFLKRIIEEKSKMLLSDYVSKTFYQPLGLQTMGYLPRLRFETARIAPTEKDMAFRKQVLQGDVHDQGAAMLGGVAGHAGLFSNANDLAVMMQLYLNKGTYGGVRYLDSTTVNEFTRIQFPANDNRRGIGFDKPEPDPKKDSPVCRNASLSSFGHLGFTGTMTWADPETGIVYVFLSNRVYPDADDNRLAKLGTRSSILKVIYESIGK